MQEFIFTIECGKRSTDSTHWPWTVQVFRADYQKKTGSTCGGVLISPAHILTAGHCIENANPEDIFIVFNNLESWFNGFTTRAQKTFMKRIPNNLEYPIDPDIAIIEMKAEFYWTQPICLPYITDEHVILNTNLTFTGYSGGFHVEEMNVFDAKKCFIKYYSGEIAENFLFLCLSDNGTIDEIDFYGTYLLPQPWKTLKYFCSKHSTDNGDSGGPLMLQAAQDSWIVV